MVTNGNGETGVAIAACAWRAMQRLRSSAAFALTVAVAAAILSGVALPAAATVLPVEGGPGGNYFQTQCPAGQYLVGFSVEAGAWIDRIAVLCATYAPSQHKFGKRTRGTPHGGNGGAPQEAYCPADSYINSLSYGYTRDGDKRMYVDDIDMGCMQVGASSVAKYVCIGSGDSCNSGGFTGGFLYHADVEPSAEGCPEGEAGIGIHGRSGDFLDALGLVCGPEPQAVATHMGKARPPAAGQQSNGHQSNVAKALRARGASALTQNATQTPTRNPTRNSRLLASSATPAAAHVSAARAAGGQSKAPTAPPSSGPPPTYALTCVGGGGMTAKSTPDGSVRISFAPAAQGSAAAMPQPGQCAWSDRGFRAGEPQMLIYSEGGKSGRDLVRAVRRRARFQLHAYNDGQGAMIVTAIDDVASGKKNSGKKNPGKKNPGKKN